MIKAPSWLVGQRAESRAKDYLQQQGLTFVEQNYHCRRGEIDLIMRDGSEYVFVEVKYRKNSSHGQALEQFTQQKRQKVVLTVQYFLQQQGLNPSIVPHRIDLLSIDNQRINWLKAI